MVTGPRQLVMAMAESLWVLGVGLGDGGSDNELRGTLGSVLGLAPALWLEGKLIIGFLR